MASATLIALYPWIYLVHRFMPWLDVVCLVILLAAAFLHWQRTRHWCLLALATGSLLMAVGAIASQIAQMQLRPEKLASGAVRVDASLLTVWMWVVASGVVVAAVGGIGAIHWAVRLRCESGHRRS